MDEKKEVEFNNTPTLAGSDQELKLDLGAGQSPREGFSGVDLYAPNPTFRVDLFKFPFPWENESVSELHCSHFLEHLPARSVEVRDLTLADIARKDQSFLPAYQEDKKRFLDKDFLFAFMDECYRILKPGGVMTVIVPSGQSVRGFQDPTHRRFFFQETFLYFSKDWRDLNKLDHYNVGCNFALNVQHTCLEEITRRHPEYQQHAFRHLWNTQIDIHALLKKV